MAKAGKTPRNVPLVALAGVLVLESAALAIVTLYLVVELVTQRPDSYASALAILVLTALAAVWVGVMAVHTLRGRSWIRGGVVTVQVLLIALAIGSFQGLFSQPAIGWTMLVPALVALVLVFTPPVVEATRRREP